MFSGHPGRVGLLWGAVWTLAVMLLLGDLHPVERVAVALVTGSLSATAMAFAYRYGRRRQQERTAPERRR